MESFLADLKHSNPHVAAAGEVFGRGYATHSRSNRIVFEVQGVPEQSLEFIGIQRVTIAA
jgi:hypothetical protein